MSYDYKETSDEIIIEKGIVTREMWKDYDHDKEHVSYEELEKALKRRDMVPLVLDTTHDHTSPLVSATHIIGSARLKPDSDKRGLKGIFTFDKTRLPVWLLERIRAREQIPLSMFQFTDVMDGEQTNLIFDHIAILAEQDPRCPIERCGIGVYDSKMSEKEKPSEPEESGTEPVSEGQPEQQGTKEPAKPIEKPEPEPVVPDALQEKDQEIQALTAELDKAKGQVKAIRDPLTTELTQRGYQLQELNPLSIQTLQKMVDESRAASTEGLPGTVPAPPPTTPQTLAEQREAEQQRFEKELKRRQDERFKDW